MGFLSDLFGGPSPQEENAQAQMAQTSKDMAYDASVSFQNNQELFKSVMSSIAPSLAKGPSQFGLSPAEEAAERTMAAQSLSSAEGVESQLVNESLASRGITPGAGISPGALAEIEGALSQKYAIAKSQADLGITEQGYEIGRENFWKSASTAESLAGEQGSLSAAQSNIGVGAGKEAFSEAQTINSQKQGVMKAILGVGGDIAGAFLGDPNLGGQLDSAIYGSPAAAGGGGLGQGLKLPGFGGPSPVDPNASSAAQAYYTATTQNPAAGMDVSYSSPLPSTLGTEELGS